jgi:hypothetical protein
VWEACGWFLEWVCRRECTLPNCVTDYPRKIYRSFPSTARWTVALLRSVQCWEASPMDLSGNVSSSLMCKVPASTGTMEFPRPYTAYLNHVRVLKADPLIRFKGAYETYGDITPCFDFIQEHKPLHVGSGCSLTTHWRSVNQRFMVKILEECLHGKV